MRRLVALDRAIARRFAAEGWGFAVRFVVVGVAVGLVVAALIRGG